jgi:hypothetical protein
MTKFAIIDRAETTQHVEIRRYRLKAFFPKMVKLQLSVFSFIPFFAF